MPGIDTTAPPTRLIALGNAALVEGFGLIGVETVRDATPEMLEELLQGLVKRQEKALLFLERHLARSGGPWLTRVRDEGGRIVITEIPPLHAPENYRPPVEDMVIAILGSQALESKP